MMSLVEDNICRSFVAIYTGSAEHSMEIAENEAMIDFINRELTKYLIKLSVGAEERIETVIGAYFHVLNDLERIGDHAENFHEIGLGMTHRGIAFSDEAKNEIMDMCNTMLEMLALAKDAFTNRDRSGLAKLAALEERVDEMKKELFAGHFARLAEGNCSVEVSPYYSSVVIGLERVSDHLVNIGFSIVNPTGSQTERK